MEGGRRIRPNSSFGGKLPRHGLSILPLWLDSLFHAPGEASQADAYLDIWLTSGGAAGGIEQGTVGRAGLRGLGHGGSCKCRYHGRRCTRVGLHVVSLLASGFCKSMHQVALDSKAYATSADPFRTSPKLRFGQNEFQEGSPCVAQEFPSPFRVLFATNHSLHSSSVRCLQRFEAPIGSGPGFSSKGTLSNYLE